MNTSAGVTVIVPVKDAGAELDRCVAALLSQDFDGRFEVVIVDNDSAEPIVPRWGPRVTVLWEGTPGSYAARNAAVRVTQGEMLAFTDVDCVPDSRWLRRGLDLLVRSGPRAIVAGEVRVSTREPPSLAERYERAYAFPIERYVDHGFGVTANLFLPRALLVELGGFDADLASGADHELCDRARSHGAAVVFGAGVLVTHPARRTARALIAKTRRVASGDVVLQRRHRRAGSVALSALWEARPPVRGWAEVCRAADVATNRERVSLLALAWLLRLVTAFERIRLLVGGGMPVTDSHVAAETPPG